MLTHPNFNLPLCIQTDASITGLGAELFQIDTYDERHTNAFARCTLIVSKNNKTTLELELLKIVIACQKFRIFILGHQIFVYTFNALKF